MHPRVITAASLVFLALAPLAAPTGACLLPAGDADVPRLRQQRVLLLQGKDQARMLVQTSCPAGGPGGCWLVPVPGPIITAQPAPTAVFSVLDSACAPHWVDDPGPAATGCSGTRSAQESIVGGGTVAWEEQPAPLEIAVLASAAAAERWLAGKGCVAPAELPQALHRLERAGWQLAGAFVPALPPGTRADPSAEGESETDVVRPPLSTDRALLVHYGRPLLGGDLSLLGLPTLQELDLLVYAVAAHRMVVRERPTIDVDPPAYLSGGAFETIYDRLLRQRLSAAGPGAMATEYAAPLKPGTTLQRALAPLDLPAADPGARWLTRLHGLLRPEELEGELTLVPRQGDTPVRVRILYSAGLHGRAGAAGSPEPPRWWSEPLLLLVLLVLLVLVRQQIHAVGPGLRAGRHPARP